LEFGHESEILFHFSLELEKDVDREAVIELTL